MSQPEGADWWEDARLAAPRLIGSVLVRVVRGRIRRGRVVETEAYTEGDPASHSFRGETARNRSMFGAPGRAYVYGIHRVVCFNVVTGPRGRGEAVLIRALEPIEGVGAMATARSRASTGIRAPRGFELTNGPGKLCQALGITRGQDGCDLTPPPEIGNDGSALVTGTAGERNPGARVEGVQGKVRIRSGIYLCLRPPVDAITRTGRIGISRARELPLRFFQTGNPWVSSGRPSPPV